LCIDEIHLGRRIVLLASDPVSDNPIACALVSRNDAEHMQRFMKNLKNKGFEPHTVISDRSPLSPRTLEQVWPKARHQLCVFHVIAEINKLVLSEVCVCHRSIGPKKIKKGRGRPSKRQQARIRKLKEKKRQAKLLFRNRYLIVQKRKNLTAADKENLAQLLSISPTLKTLRKFTDDVYALFTLRRSKNQAWKIWRRMRRTAKYRNNPSLRKALDVLSKPNMKKLLVYLDRPLAGRTKVRTNNHVERCNRKIRYLEKVRYKWRRPKSILRHILLQFQNWLKNKLYTTQLQI
jgi:hypothetical protein